MIIALLAAATCLIFTPLLQRIRPRGSLPPRIGGVGIFLAVLAGVFLSPLIKAGGIESGRMTAYWVGLVIVFAMGLADDFLVLSPKVKLLFQTLSAGVFLSFLPFTWWTPVFFVWLVGVTNSLNLLDNMDGLTPGVGAVAALFFYLLSPFAPLAALAGALVAFLVFNFHPARVYLGDAGSHLVGFTLAAIPLLGDQWRLAPLVLLVPIVDTAFVTVTRIARGVSPFKGGKDHISHRLQRLGLSVPVVVVLFYAVTAVVGTVAWIASAR
ncbi:MAG: undecaprenyl/decaprenyl-phosphate alpha-N-acetylglucosaminyl 1-phosphate transferase [Acidobacteria bacterium]|nr:MAG: undecaprenyl/decaprenyl-phosphate alpha-N-acetylglucosaminyl 1-phosphate transferase [Acidobacteriota bacterium]